MKLKVSYANNRKIIELPMKDAQLNVQFKQLGEDNVVPWCKILLVLEDDNPLQRLEGHAVNMDEVNYFAWRMESLTEYEKRVINAYANEHEVKSVRDLINLSFGLNGLSLITDFSDAERVGRRLYLDEFVGVSEEQVKQINFIEFAEKVFLEEKLKVLPYGVLVKHGFQMPQIYNGKTFPEYVYSDEIVMSLEIKNQSGEADYLYLPTDKVSVDKLKARLGVERFEECTVTGINNIRLPPSLVPGMESINDIQSITELNEFCSEVKELDAEQLECLSMIVEYVKPKHITDLTCIAQNRNGFEVVSDVWNDEEYGKFIVTKSGYFDVNELILPHINYASFAEERRKSIFKSSGYVSGGFVGAHNALEQYMNYTGAFADVLELNEEQYIDYNFFSPLTASWTVDGFERDFLYGRDLLEHQEAIEEALLNYSLSDPTRGLMHYYSDDQKLAEKVVIAKPSVQVINGELYGVLECKLKQGLTEEEILKLKEYWTGQMSDGWGEGFEQQEIKLDEGELYVSFWSSEKFWEVYTEDELSYNEQCEIAPCGLRVNY